MAEKARKNGGKKAAAPAPLRSGELAAAAGIGVDSLRHYERLGLLPSPPRLENGYRSYPAESLARVRLIQRAHDVGFDLKELARILQARDRGEHPCREVRALGAGKLADVEREIEALQAFRETLRRTLADWDRRLARSRKGEPARLLESLVFSLGTTNAPPQLRGARFDRRKRRKENR
jgi:DNA-binding transcriptional MerR regulator